MSASSRRAASRWPSLARPWPSGAVRAPSRVAKRLCLWAGNTLKLTASGSERPAALSERDVSQIALVLLSGMALMFVVGLVWHQVAVSSEDGFAGPARRAEPEVVTPQPARQVLVEPGWRVEQIAVALEGAGVISAAEFLDAVAHPDGEGASLGSPPTLEGYLLPGAYELDDGMPAGAVLSVFRGRFEQQITAEISERAEQKGLTLHELLTLASIVERETHLDAERPVIASVYLNRLREGLPLAADPTLIYAMDSEKTTASQPGTYWELPGNPLDATFPSPYNTYAHPGLPPGPIASPGMTSIEAVLNAPATEYFFFSSDGVSHRFARTELEHERNVDLAAEASRSDPVLQNIVEQAGRVMPTRVGVAANQLGIGRGAHFNSDKFFYGGDLYALLLALTAQRLSESGELDLDAARLGEGSTTTRQLVETALAPGAEAAREALLDALGLDAVNSVAGELGLESSWLTGAGFLTTPSDVARLVSAVYNGEAANGEFSGYLLESMRTEPSEDPLTTQLPPNAVLAHKFGEAGDSGFYAAVVSTLQGPIVVAALVDGVGVAAGGADLGALASLSELIYHYFESYVPSETSGVQSVGVACGANPFSPAGPGPLTERTIVLDPGHGGSESGAAFKFEDGHTVAEKDVVLDVALRLKDLLVAQGATVYMTRCRDVGISPFERAAFANSVVSDLFISVHANGASEPARDGVEVYYASESGRVAANYLLGSFVAPALWDELNAGLSLPNRGIHLRPFTVVSFTLTPGVLTESVYLTNPAEAEALRDQSVTPSARRQQIANGHLDGILNYFRSTPPSDLPDE